MKPGNNNRRPRGRGQRKPHGHGMGNGGKSQGYEGGGEFRVRGNAHQILERYLQLARDAGMAGDRIAAENYLQHADHYYRVLAAMQDGQRPRIGGREVSVADVNVQNVSQGLSAALSSSSGQVAPQSNNHDSMDGNDNHPAGNRHPAQSNNPNRDHNAGMVSNEGQEGEGRPNTHRDNHRMNVRPNSYTRDEQPSYPEDVYNRRPIAAPVAHPESSPPESSPQEDSANNVNRQENGEDGEQSLAVASREQDPGQPPRVRQRQFRRKPRSIEENSIDSLPNEKNPGSPE